MNFSDLRRQKDSGVLTKHEFIHAMYKKHGLLFEYQDLICGGDVQKIEIRHDGVISTIKHSALNFVGEGPQFYWIVGDERIAPIEILNFGSYEACDFAMIVQLLEGAKVFFDVGGNIGFHSLSLSRQFPDLRCEAFEPVPQTFANFTRNRDLNHAENVRIHPFGMSNKAAEIKFYFSPTGSGNASATNLSPGADVLEVTSTVRTMDSFVSEEKLVPDFIKCDVEGAELFALEGAKETLRSARPIVFAEILRKWSRQFNYDPNEIFQLMDALGYGAFTAAEARLKPFGHMTEETPETNFFFLHREQHRAQIQRFGG